MGQNVCLNKISDKFEWVTLGFKLGQWVKLKPYCVGAPEATFVAQLT